MRDVLKQIEAEASQKPKRRVYVRVAPTNDATYVDLGNDAGDVVEITADGWGIIATKDLPEGVAFKRSKTMRPLPTPKRGGSIAELRPFVNVEPDGETPRITDANFVLYVMWLACS